jgi:hypothetical protein
MSTLETLTLAAYFFVLIVLAIYGWHRYYLVYLYMKHRDREPHKGAPLHPLPVVTIQLPLTTRCKSPTDSLPRSAPSTIRELLEIQCSTIRSTRRSIAEMAVRRFAAEGVDISTSTASIAPVKGGALQGRE